MSAVMNVLAAAVNRWSVTGLLMVALLGGAWWSGWGEARHWPIRWLEVSGEVERVATAQIRAAVADQARRGFFAVDVDAARAAVEALPWVKRASVARQWPDALSILVIEQRAVARFNGDALVNPDGELFHVAGTASMQGLVDLTGPEDRHARVVQGWRSISRLLRPEGLSLSRVDVDARGSWRVVLGDGVELLLGRDEIEQRVQRYLSVRQALAQRGAPSRIDLRYPNGLSVTPERTTPVSDPARLAERATSTESGVDPNHG